MFNYSNWFNRWHLVYYFIVSALHSRRMDKQFKLRDVCCMWWSQSLHKVLYAVCMYKFFILKDTFQFEMPLKDM